MVERLTSACCTSAISWLKGQIHHRWSSRATFYAPTESSGSFPWASDPAGAKALLQYLLLPEAQAIFKEEGFEPHK
jgi:hypothetical protein